MSVQARSGNHPLRIAEKGNLDNNRDIFGIFDDFLGSFPKVEMGEMKKASDWSPRMNVVETDKTYEFDSELPGVNKKNIDIEIKDNNLIIKGEKSSYDETNKSNYHCIERSHGSFYRCVSLPSDANNNKVKADLNDGVLHVSIEKSEEKNSKKKKISIH